MSEMASNAGGEGAVEAGLRALNALLAREPLPGPAGSAGPGLDCVLVTGQPRSGTTLATQLLARRARVRVVDNIAARLWERPDLGIAVSRSVLGDDARPGLESNHGQTPRPQDPHELGGFWRSRLGEAWETPGAELPAGCGARLVRDFRAMRHAAGVPVVLKCFSVPWLLPALDPSEVAGLAVVHVRRDLVAVADSVLRLREDTGRAWTGPRAPGWAAVRDLPVPLHVAWQVLALDRIFDGVSTLEGVVVADTTLDQLARDPGPEVERLARQLDIPVHEAAPDDSTNESGRAGKRADTPRRLNRAEWDRWFSEARKLS